MESERRVPRGDRDIPAVDGLVRYCLAPKQYSRLCEVYIRASHGHGLSPYPRLSSQPFRGCLLQRLSAQSMIQENFLSFANQVQYNRHLLMNYPATETTGYHPGMVTHPPQVYRDLIPFMIKSAVIYKIYKALHRALF